MIMQLAIQKRASLVSALVLLGASMAGCLPTETPVAAPAVPRVVDTTEVVLANGPEQVTLSGQVQASEHTQLSFEVGGEIRVLSADVGDAVSAGQVLATLDSGRYQLAHDQALASEREAAAALQEARLDQKRQSDLSGRGFGSQSRLDSANAALESARYRHQAAVASRRMAERDLAQTELRAPFEGTVSQRLVEPAERVTAGQPVLSVISDREGYEVNTSVPETLVSRLAPGSVQRVSIPALAIGPTPARIQQVGSEPLSANNYPVTLILERRLPGLRSGMTAQVHLAMAQTSGGESGELRFRIPLTALVYEGDQRAHVLRLGADSRLQRVAVTVVATVDNNALVTGELATGERLVARGPEFVTEGEQVSALGDGPERFH